jgi:uncharacterized protein
MNYLIRIAVIAFIALILWSIFRRAGQQNENSQPMSPRTPELKQGKMLCCDECGVHFPQEESVRAGEKVFCCEEHRKQSLKKLSN